VPLDLFTLARTFRLKEVGNGDEFLYIFVLVLSAEAIESHKFDLNTRVVIIETFLLLFLNQKSLMNIRCPQLNEKISRENIKVTFASRKKLQRFVCTLGVQYVALLTGDLRLGLDRIGSHTEENYIGNIRMICDRDNRVAKVRRQLS
jgi:hypothetical protein